MRIYPSSGHFSHDDQVADVVSWFSLHPDYQTFMDEDFSSEFPEYNYLKWSGSWVDWEESGVDAEYMSWVTDYLEQHLPVLWEDGEPVISWHPQPCLKCADGHFVGDHDQVLAKEALRDDQD